MRYNDKINMYFLRMHYTRILLIICLVLGPAIMSPGRNLYAQPADIAGSLLSPRLEMTGNVHTVFQVIYEKHRKLETYYSMLIEHLQEVEGYYGKASYVEQWLQKYYYSKLFLSGARIGNNRNLGYLQLYIFDINHNANRDPWPHGYFYFGLYHGMLADINNINLIDNLDANILYRVHDFFLEWDKEGRMLETDRILDEMHALIEKATARKISRNFNSAAGLNIVIKDSI